MTSRKPKEANCAMESNSLNRSLDAARAAKQDEFYTQYVDIQKEVDAYLEMSDAALLARRFLDEAAAAVQAETGAVSLAIDGRLQTVGTIGRWQGEALIAIPLQHDSQRYGLLRLGLRLGGSPYSRAEFEALQQAAQPVARALRLALHVHPAVEHPATAPAAETGEPNPTVETAHGERPSSRSPAVSPTR